MKQFIICVLLLTGYTAMAGDLCTCIDVKPGNGEFTHLIEKKKSVSYSYKLDTQDPVSIENHFGDVKVKFWNKNQVRVDITITANAPTVEKLDAFLNIVNIQSVKEGGEARFVTKLNCYKSAFGNNISKEDEKNFLRVDYQVYMPENHNLSVNNSHGDVYIPAFNAVLKVKQDYGNLYTDHIKNSSSVIDVNFGKAFIKSMTGGELKAKQTSLLIDRVQNVSMTNTCGSLKVLEANNSHIKATYTKGYIGKVNESCEFTVNYSKDFKLGEILEDVEQLQISTSYTNFELPLCLKGTYDLRTNCKNTDVVMNEKSKIQLINSPNSSQKNYIIGGDNSERATKVHLTTNYGKVEVK